MCATLAHKAPWQPAARTIVTMMEKLGPDLQNEDLLHKLRVEIKKIRVILGMYRPGLFETGSLDQLFQRTGKIRKYQVLFQLAHSQISCPDDILCALRRRIRKNHRRLFRSLDQLRADVEKELMSVDPDPGPGRRKSYVKAQAEKIQQLLQAGIADPDLHTLRKESKSLTYLSQIFPDAVRVGQKPLYKLLEKLQQVLGEWHDVQTGLNYLKKHGFQKRGIYRIFLLRSRDLKRQADAFIKALGPALSVFSAHQ